MAEVVLPPEDVAPHLDGRPVVFLAGSIDQNRAENWQAKVVEALSDVDCVVLNPRRKDWDSSWEQDIGNPDFRGQVEWELEGLDEADVVAMCLTAGSKAPISLLELGLYAADGKMVVCCPEGFWRKGNVDVVCARHGVPVFEDFGRFAAAVECRVRESRVASVVASERTAGEGHPRRAPKGWLLLEVSAVPNHDFDDQAWEAQVSLRPEWLKVASLDQAVTVAMMYRGKHELGGGNWSGGQVWDEDGRMVARISYNGRAWEPGRYPTPEIDVRRFDEERDARRT